MLANDWACGGRRRDYKLIGKRKLLGKGHFITLIVVVVSQLYTYVKIYKIVCLKCSFLYANYSAIKLLCCFLRKGQGSVISRGEASAARPGRALPLLGRLGLARAPWTFVRGCCFSFLFAWSAALRSAVGQHTENAHCLGIHHSTASVI